MLIKMVSGLCNIFFFARQVSDYLEVIRQPMDLSTVMTKIDTHQYLTVKEFLVDIDLICNNALEYNPDKDPGGEEEMTITCDDTNIYCT